MTDKLRQAAEMVLRSLKDFESDGYTVDGITLGFSHEIKALEQALAESDTGIDRGAWSDVPDATKWVDELRGEEPDNRKNRITEEQALERYEDPDEQNALDWHHPECEGSCLACLIEKLVKEEFGASGHNYLLKRLDQLPDTTKMINHTPGPWRVADFSNGVQICSERDQVAKIWMMRNGEGKANANLIAAAPDLLEALQELKEELFQHAEGNYFRPFLDKAEAAIAKARGE